MSKGADGDQALATITSHMLTTGRIWAACGGRRLVSGFVSVVFQGNVRALQKIHIIMSSCRCQGKKTHNNLSFLSQILKVPILKGNALTLKRLLAMKLSVTWCFPKKCLQKIMGTVCNDIILIFNYEI